MSRVNVPDYAAEVLGQLSKIPAHDLAKLFIDLGKVSKGLLLHGSMTAAISQFSATHSLDGKKVTSIAHSLNVARAQDHLVTDADFVEDIADQVVEGSDEEVNKDAIKAVVVNFLALENVRISASATALLIEHQNCLFDVDIMSDLRTVFDKPSGQIKGGIISLILKVGYGEDGDSKSAYFAMTEDDLDVVDSAIRNARLQCKALRDLLIASNTPLLESSK